MPEPRSKSHTTLQFHCSDPQTESSDHSLAEPPTCIRNRQPYSNCGVRKYTLFEGMDESRRTTVQLLCRHDRVLGSNQQPVAWGDGYNQQHDDQSAKRLTFIVPPLAIGYPIFINIQQSHPLVKCYGSLGGKNQYS